MKASRRWRWANLLLLWLGALLMIAPIFWMVSTSLKSPDELFTFPPTWVPSPPRWRNFVDFWGAVPVRFGFFRFAWNSIVIAVLCVIGQTCSCLLVGYGFARYRFKGRQHLFALLLATMMLPGAVTMIPTFMMFRQLGWLDTYLPLTVPAFFGGSAFNIFLARQFFKTFPVQLEEAARLDGCNGWQTFYLIYLPLSRPLAVTIAIFSFTASWKDFMGPLLYLNSMEKFTLTLGLSWFKTNVGAASGTPYHLLMAATLVVVAPLIIVFLCAQRSFTQGIAMTGLKE